MKSGKGGKVNLERSVRADQRLDGHIVQGHVEGMGALQLRHWIGKSLEIHIQLPPYFRPLMVSKGSIAVNGVSLTVNRIEDLEDQSVVVSINLIPHTLSQTNLEQGSVGELCNIESDIFARYAQRFWQLGRD